MSRLLLILSLALLSFVANAQTVIPGYQGRKISLVGDFSFFGTFSQPNINWYSGITSFNTRMGAQLNLARSKDTELGLSYDYLETRLTVPVQVEFLQSVFLEKEARASMQTHIFGLNKRLYLGNYVAPLGHYMEYGVALSHSIIKDVDEDLDLFEFEMKSANFNNAILQLTFGNQNLWFNRLLTNVSVQGMYVFKSGLINNSTTAISNDLRDAARKRLRDHVNINVNVGVGILF